MKTSEFLYNNNISVLFSSKTYSESYKVAVQECTDYNNKPIWYFGKLYDGNTFMPQGCKSHRTKNEAIKEACKYFGMERHPLFRYIFVNTIKI